jgi:hypothetical protein
MKNLIIALVALFTFIFAAAQAEDAKVNPTPKPQVNITAKDVKLTPGKASEGTVLNNFTWGAEERRPFGLYALCINTKSSEWTTFSISFTPETDGKVYVSLAGNWYKSKDKKEPNSMWVYYSKFTAEGATVKNGDFTEAKDGKPVGWLMHKDAKYIDGGEGALAGKKAVLVCRLASCDQSIDVKGGQEVTLTFVVMPGEFEESAE